MPPSSVKHVTGSAWTRAFLLGPSFIPPGWSQQLVFIFRPGIGRIGCTWASDPINETGTLGASSLHGYGVVTRVPIRMAPCGPTTKMAIGTAFAQSLIDSIGRFEQELALPGRASGTIVAEWVKRCEARPHRRIALARILTTYERHRALIAATVKRYQMVHEPGATVSQIALLCVITVGALIEGASTHSVADVVRGFRSALRPVMPTFLDSIIAFVLNEGGHSRDVLCRVYDSPFVDRVVHAMETCRSMLQGDLDEGRSGSHPEPRVDPFVRSFDNVPPPFVCRDDIHIIMCRPHVNHPAPRRRHPTHPPTSVPSRQRRQRHKASVISHCEEASGSAPSLPSVDEHLAKPHRRLLRRSQSVPNPISGTRTSVLRAYSVHREAMRHQAHVMRAYEVELRDANDLVQWRSAEHAAAEARRLDDARQKHDAEAMDRKARQARAGDELERKQRQALMDKSASTTRLMRRCQSDLHEQRLKRKRAELSKAVAARARTDRERRLNASRAEGAMQIRQWHQDAHVNERVGIAEDRATRQRVAETVRTSERIAEDRKHNGPRLGVSLARLAATEFAAHWTRERSRREWIRDTRRQDIRQSIDADRADVQRRAEVVVNARREWHPDKSRCSVQDCTPGCHRQLTTSCSAVSLYVQAKELVDKAERSQCEREAKMAHEQRYVHDVVQRLGRERVERQIRLMQMNEWHDSRAVSDPKYHNLSRSVVN